MSESIRTFWRLGYFKLLDWPNMPNKKRHISTEDGEWRRVIGRFYWRTYKYTDLTSLEKKEGDK